MFSLQVIVTKMCFAKFWAKISPELLKTTLNFVLNFLNLEIYHKNQVHGSDHGLWNILHKSVTILIFHICIKSLRLVWFLRIYLVSEQIQFMNQILIYIQVLAHKTPGKAIQEQIYVNNIVRIKSRFFANKLTWKTLK